MQTSESFQTQIQNCQSVTKAIGALKGALILKDFSYLPGIEQANVRITIGP